MLPNAPLRVVDDDVLESIAAERRRALEHRLNLERRAMQRRQAERRRRRKRIRRNRTIAAGLLVALIVALALSLSGGGSSQATLRSNRPSALVHTSVATRFVVVPGHLPIPPWPAKGQGALATSGGLIAASSREHVVPIASLTKMMTAYVILADHPLSASANGPTLTMTAADVARFVHASQTDESNSPVTLGESLSERQLLEALMLPSADNIAETLAIWDAGSIASFVHKMNVTATALGLSHTHYADSSGVDPGSRSTAADQAVLAATLMENAAIDSIVSQRAIAFPVAGHIYNVNPALGVDGIVGVKSGYTSKALGCLATAAYRSVGDKQVLVVAVSLSQPDGLYGAARADEQLLASTKHALVLVRPVSQGRVLGTVTSNGAMTPLVLKGAAPVFVGWPGMRINEQVVPAIDPGPKHLARIVFSTDSGSLGTADLVAAQPSSSSN